MTAAEIQEPNDTVVDQATAETVINAYLAGETHAQIALVLGLTTEQVVQVIEIELERRNPDTPGSISIEMERATGLWKTAYEKAMKGDLVAHRMALSLSQYRIRLHGMAERARRSGELAKPGGQSDIQQAWTLLAGGAPSAARALLDVATNGRSELARVTASTAILDRVGLIGKPEVQVAVIPQDVLAATRSEQTESLADLVRQRLKQLAPAPMEEDLEDEFGYSYSAGESVLVIDAEVVEP